MKFRKNILVICSLAFLLIVAFISTATADAYFKQETYTSEAVMMGTKTPERYDTTETWVGNNKAYAVLPGNYAILINLDEKIGISINHNNFSYATIPIDFEVLLYADAAPKKDNKDIDPHTNMMGNLKVTVTKTEETKKIDDWDTKKYLLTLTMGKMTMSSEIWTTESIKIDYNLFYLVSNSMMASMPGFENLVSEFNKIKGVAVVTNGELSMMGATSISRNSLLEYKEAEAPKTTYDIPHGYTKIKTPGGH